VRIRKRLDADSIDETPRCISTSVILSRGWRRRLIPRGTGRPIHGSTARLSRSRRAPAQLLQPSSSPVLHTFTSHPNLSTLLNRKILRFVRNGLCAQFQHVAEFRCTGRAAVKMHSLLNAPHFLDEDQALTGIVHAQSRRDARFTGSANWESKRHRSRDERLRLRPCHQKCSRSQGSPVLFGDLRVGHIFGWRVSSEGTISRAEK